MISHLILTFLPEILLLAVGVSAILTAAFTKGKLPLSFVYGFRLILAISFIWLLEISPFTEGVGLGEFLGANGYTTFFKLIILGAFFLIQLAISPHLEKKGLYKAEFFALMTFTAAGYLLMVSSQHFLSLFLAAELASFSSYLMVAFNRDHLASTEAGLKYFILGALGTAFFLLGVSFIYGAVGSLSFDKIACFVGPSSFYVKIGLLLIITAFSFKLSLVPFHMWTPDVYQGAPTPVALLLTTLPKIATWAVLIRLGTEVFPTSSSVWKPILMGLSFLSMTLGAFSALFQQNIKRIIAYSTIAHMGYGLLGLIAGHFHSLVGLIIYVLIYAVTTIGVFACLLCLKRHGKVLEELEDFRGLGTECPFVAGSLMVFLFSLAGLPPLAGFFAKLTIFSEAIAGGYTELAIVGVLVSVVAAGFYLKIIRLMYFEAAQGGAEALIRVDAEQSKMTLTVMTGCLLAVLAYGLFLDQLPHRASRAVKPLFSHTLRK